MKPIITRAASFVLASVMSLSLTSCDLPYSSPILSASPIKLSGDLIRDIDKDNNPDSIAPDEEFTASQTAFALHLLQQEAAQNSTSNLLISPYSVMQALAMSAAGAEGETRNEMEQVLGGIPSDRLNAYLHHYRTNQPAGSGCQMLTANSVWYPAADSSVIIRKDYLSRIASAFNADAYQRIFDQSVVNDINKWVNAKTGGRIPDILQELNPMTRMFLVNACVFDAKWKNKYKQDHIRDDVFHAADGTDQTVRMMNSNEKYALTDTNAKGFIKPYQDGRYAFAAILPDEGVSVNSYIAELTPERLQSIFENRKIAHVATDLPKFSGDYKTDLKESLAAMGMDQAFDYDKADFSGMTENGKCGIFIASVLHRTHIEIDEHGTKAAAVTAVRKDVSAADPIDLYISLNRPFLYCILDLQTNLPVFIGIRQSI